MSYHKLFLFPAIVLLFPIAEIRSASGGTDTQTIHAIEREVRSLQTTTNGIVTELRRQKDASTYLQNEFKWLRNELKTFKKALSDIDLVVNRTNGDTQFIRDKLSNISQSIQKMVTTPAPPVQVPVPAKNTTSANPSITPTKKFILF